MVVTVMMVGFLRWVSVVSLLAVVFLDGFIISSSYAAFTPVDNYLIACGSSQNVTVDGRVYVPDTQSSSLVLTDQGSSIVSSNFLAPSPIYQSARVFPRPTSFQFEIRQSGRHWVRLYFYPVPNSEYALNSTLLTVVTDDFVLLNNHSLKDQNRPYLFKEYLINVTSDHLSITFVPMNGSVSFVNGIEVVSVPDDLIVDQVPQVALSTPFVGIPTLALETVYRLNVGGPRIVPMNDTLGRTWENDQKFLYYNDSAKVESVDPSTISYGEVVSPEIAPNWVYATAEIMVNVDVANVIFNITWSLPVDPSFLYLIRLHFCDIISMALNQLVFDVYINSYSGIAGLDLSRQTNVLRRPYYADFVSNVSSGSPFINISIGPDTTIMDVSNATLNGLEIMKMSNDARSLEGSLSVRDIYSGAEKTKKKLTVIVAVVLGIVAAVLLVVLYYCCFAGPRSKRLRRAHSWLPLPLYGNSHTISKVSTISQKSGTASCISMANSNLGRTFTFQEIMEATNKFDDALLLGVGGFGKVYKGTLDDATNVAVKRGNPRSEQGLTEFQTEIQMLSKLRHRHLVSLIGYCDERSEMILVYEYMANGPLRSHLYGSDFPPLMWKQRLEICIGAARGLHYLHTGATQSIIHRDVKTTNILLDENFVAKVADFGLSKTGPALDQTHVSTAVKGSFGYLDPEYFRRQQLTEKSDVYSFGVVLMEVLCSRPALNPVLPREQVSIAEWAMMWQKKGLLSHIMDPYLSGKVNPASLKKFGETAEKCLAEQGVDRPTMGDVLWNLEYALQLQETSSLNDPDDNSTNHIADISVPHVHPFDNSMSMINGAHSVTDDDAEDLTTSAVFSQLVNPRGR
ncbi:receptor-like protein kinase THESEUS 1 [Nymphaea colorata]|uniref:Protein kinase domain-containing protein n=1 Tax=Nymphaea colorata TaxID=210225 RepID=A0A5K0XPC9_9MAGN|nr:receptor-like protein kinase THESEUS 1 [Nymphaea colorata]